ncbi:DUF84 family protein [Paraliobacillus ryukyuensis]|uniref:DUF84 family protein n=1 Tax=Paraliobacillus ryukyuensis TaxID=200904 RepID=UPI0009A6C65A|nr:DUF84 family protein [Paraliobacillus ryukyuensis]
MEIIIGSQNPAKINAVQEVFLNANVISKDVPSNVGAQPISDEETMQGAINRAKHSAKLKENACGIGLEGGVTRIKKQVFLCNWGALVDRFGEVYVASGARIPLPKEIVLELEKGNELGDIMVSYANKQDIRKKEGAIGIFTNETISRKDMFVHVVHLLKGQYAYGQSRN